jgi:hypothetical protein
LAAQYGLNLKDSKLADRPCAIHVLYAGGNSLSRLLVEHGITFARCGSNGEWTAVLPAEHLIQLLEVEHLWNQSLRKKVSHD